MSSPFLDSVLLFLRALGYCKTAQYPKADQWQLGCSLGWSIWCPCGRFQSESHGPHLASGWTRWFRPLWRPKSVVCPFCGHGCNLNRSAAPSKFQHVPTYFEATGQLSDHNTPIFQLPNRDPNSWDVNSPTCYLRGKTLSIYNELWRGDQIC